MFASEPKGLERMGLCAPVGFKKPDNFDLDLNREVKEKRKPFGSARGCDIRQGLRHLLRALGKWVSKSKGSEDKSYPYLRIVLGGYHGCSIRKRDGHSRCTAPNDCSPHVEP